MTLKLKEEDFQTQITTLAEWYGYRWVHFRPAQTSKGWRTPVSGLLGKGWPDLLLTRSKDKRHVFVELKAKGQQPKEHQREVLAYLRECGFEAYVWWPQDLETAKEILR